MSWSGYTESQNVTYRSYTSAFPTGSALSSTVNRAVMKSSSGDIRPS